MKAWVSAVSVAAVLAVVAPALNLSSRVAAASSAMRPVPAHETPLSDVEARAVIENYCLQCHDADHAKGDLVLEAFDPAKADQHAETAEKMVRKLRAGMMPPPGADHPAEATLESFAATFETKLDAASDAHPNPGHRTFQRLNRAEYAQEIHDIFGLDVDVNAFLPTDTISHNFDNIADVQGMSATVLEGYLRAASQVSKLAVGDPS